MKRILMIVAVLALSTLVSQAETWEQASIDTEHALQNRINADAQFTRDENARRAREEAREARAQAAAEARQEAIEFQQRQREATEREAAQKKRFADAIAAQNRRHAEHDGLAQQPDSDAVIKTFIEANGYHDVTQIQIDKVRAYMSANHLLHVSQIGH
jgi:hypothetical protein